MARVRVPTNLKNGCKPTTKQRLHLAVGLWLLCRDVGGAVKSTDVVCIRGAEAVAAVAQAVWVARQQLNMFSALVNARQLESFAIQINIRTTLTYISE